MVKKLFSPEVILINENGESIHHINSIAEVLIDVNLIINDIKIYPFQDELPNTEYCDPPLILHKGEKLVIKIF